MIYCMYIQQYHYYIYLSLFLLILNRFSVVVFVLTFHAHPSFLSLARSIFPRWLWQRNFSYFHVVSFQDSTSKLTRHVPGNTAKPSTSFNTFIVFCFLFCFFLQLTPVQVQGLPGPRDFSTRGLFSKVKYAAHWREACLYVVFFSIIRLHPSFF